MQGELTSFLLKIIQYFFFLLSAGESRAKGSPARPSESASSQQSRSSMETDPLSKCSGLLKTGRLKTFRCYPWGEMFHFLFYEEDADFTDKQKKQTLNPHIELREWFFL